MRSIYLLLTLSTIFGSCSIPKKEDKIDVSNIVVPEADHEYFEVEKFTINWNTIFDQDKKTYFVYLYSLTCEHCKELKNWIIEQALNRDDIFFVKSSNKVVVKTDISDTIGATTIEEVAIFGYPSLLKIENKAIAKNVAGNNKIIELLK